MAEDMRRQVARKLADLLGAPEVYGLIGSLSGVGVLAERCADVVLDVVAHGGESRLVDHLSGQLDATRAELERTRRELWFEVNGSRTFAGADARVARGERIAPFVETAPSSSMEPSSSSVRSTLGGPDDDARLLAVAESRVAADTGDRHSLDEVSAALDVHYGGPPFTHKGGQPCYGCQICFADALDDDGDVPGVLPEGGTH